MESKRKKIVAWSIGFCIKAVKNVFQMQSGCCRFYPSCTEFAQEAVERLPLSTAIWLIVKRLIRCHPFVPAGFDPVTDDSFFRKRGRIG